VEDITMAEAKLAMDQVNLIVEDMDAALAFY
jgi:hypothetical protein